MKKEHVNIGSKGFTVDSQKADRNICLLKDAFEVASEASTLQKGIVVFATRENTIISIYNFLMHSTVEIENSNWRLLIEELSKRYGESEIKGHILQMGDEEIYMIFAMGIEEDSILEISSIIYRTKEIYGVAKKYARVGDTVLTALDNVNDAVSYAEKSGIVRYANKACFDMLETTEEELIGADLHEFVTSGKPMLLEVIKSGQSVIDAEYSVEVHKKKYYFVNSGYPVFNQGNQLIGAIDIFKSMERSIKLTNSMAGYKASLTFDSVVYKSESMAQVISLAKLFAKSDEIVLLSGESGVGKDVFAQAIHNYSGRKDGPFIAVNCANFVNDLIDSELFGYDEGAFTGASKGGRQGKFELASGGTLFLDEIGEMPIHLQAKLLRVLETMCITKVGGSKSIKIDVRIIAATNRNLENCIKQGTFRSDLYYRLKVLSLTIPPLRERKEDIPCLAKHFLGLAADRMGRNNITISEKALEMLREYYWPGNIRELTNLISRVLFMCENDHIDGETLNLLGIDIDAAVDCPWMGQAKDENPNVNGIRKEERPKSRQPLNKESFTKAYKECRENKKKTAEILGISRPTVYKLLKEYGIEE